VRAPWRAPALRPRVVTCHRLHRNSRGLPRRSYRNLIKTRLRCRSQLLLQRRSRCFAARRNTYEIAIPQALSSSRFFMARCVFGSGDSSCCAFCGDNFADPGKLKAMKRSADPRARRNNGRRQPIAISAAIAVLALTTLLCAAFVAVPLWTALVHGWQVETISQPCGLKDAAARQDCLEKLRLGESQHPAKGANAPIRLHAPEQNSD
jgi:hypothetical protein